MKKIIIYITMLFCSYVINAQNSAVFSPASQSVSVDSGEDITARIRVNGSGNSDDSIFINISPTVIDEGYRGFTISNTTLNITSVEYIDVSFRKNVTNTSTKEYKFNASYSSGSNFGTKEIIIKVTYNAPEEEPEEVCELSAPSSPVATNITENSAKLDWSTVSGNDGYEYAYRESGKTLWSTGTTSSSSVNIGNLVSDTTYQWRVRAECSNGLYGDWTSIQSFTTLTGCNDLVTITNDVSSGTTDNQSAQTTITATNTVNSGAIAAYDAGTTVSLKAGFNAESGAIFNAFIEGCSTTSSKTVTSEESEKQAISEEEEGILVSNTTSIYPNPTTGMFTISSNETITHYAVFNSLSTVLYSNEVHTNKVVVNIQNLPMGMYMVRFTLASGEIVMKKIIKK